MKKSVLAIALVGTPACLLEIPDMADQGGGSTCASLEPQPRFCVDFDEGMTIDKAFGPRFAATNGDATVDEDTASSPPASAYFWTTTTTTPLPLVYYSHVFPDAPSAFRMTFDVLVESATKNNGDQLADVFQMDVGSNQLRVAIQSNGTSLNRASLEEALSKATTACPSTYCGHNLSPPQMGVWTRYAIDVDVNAHRVKAQTGAITDPLGQALPDGDVVLDPLWASGPLKLLIGFLYVGGATGPWKIRLDNVIVDY